MNRTWKVTLVLAVALALAIAVIATFAYRGVRAAFETEFQRQIVYAAEAVASQLGTSDMAKEVENIRELGSESDGYYAWQAELDILKAVKGFKKLAVVDTLGLTLYDSSLDDQGLLALTPYKARANAALQRAIDGKPASAVLHDPAGETRAEFTPMRPGGHGRVIGVLVVEAAPTWGPELDPLRTYLTLLALLSIAVIAALSGFFVRAIARQIELGRQLSHSENLAAMGRQEAVLAHEIKNPLANIRGSARRLGKLDPEAERLAESIVEEVDRISRTITVVLQFARSESHHQGTGDLTAALVSTLDMLEAAFRERRCTLERDGLTTPILVRLDPDGLKQVAVNLVHNSLEAVPEGGFVRVRLAVVHNHVELRISDNGSGMPADLLKKVGEPFVTTKAKGTGLGLFITRRLVKEAGGTLRVESKPGQGTAVTVRLPLARE